MNTLFVATSAINGVFIYSSLLTYSICKFSRLPYSNVNSADNNVVLNLINSTMISAVFAGLLDIRAHSILSSIYCITMHAIMVEFVYYFIHRSALHHPYFYDWFHKDEHIKPLVCPGDTLFMNPYDFTAHMVSMHLPLLFLRANYGEYFVVMLFFLTAKHFEFTNMFYDHHLSHMSNPTASFCVVFPVFDFFYDTQWWNAIIHSDDEEENDDDLVVDADNVDTRDDGLSESNFFLRIIEKSVLDAFGRNIDDDDSDTEYEKITEESIKSKND
jgi:hypothetical protein